MPSCPIHEAAVKRLCRRAAHVSQADWQLAEGWYPGERSWIEAEAEPFGVPTERACAAFAALSPRVQYSANRQALLDLLAGRPMQRILPRNGVIAAAAIKDGVHVVRGPKTSRFAANLNGDPNPVTVDVWMMRAYGSDLDAPKSKGHYEVIERAFQGAARRLAVEPRVLQAALWFDIRGDKPTDPEWRANE